MKRCCLLSFLLILTLVPAAFAQVMDMRAFSRQRGFSAYQAKRAYAPRQAVVPASPKKELKDDEKNPKEQPQNEEIKKEEQTKEMQDYIANNPHVLPDIGI